MQGQHWAVGLLFAGHLLVEGRAAAGCDSCCPPASARMGECEIYFLVQDMPVSALLNEVEVEEGIFLCLDERRQACMKLDPCFLFAMKEDILRHLRSNFTPSGMSWFFDSENASHYSDIPDVGEHYAFKRYAMDNDLTSHLLLQIVAMPSN